MDEVSGIWIETSNPKLILCIIHDLTSYLASDGFEGLKAWIIERDHPSPEMVEGADMDTNMRTNLQTLHDAAVECLANIPSGK